MSHKIKVLPPLERGHFAYGSNGVTVDGIAPVPPDRLRELLFTDQTREEDYKIMTKSWIMAQLRYYEIRFSVAEKTAELKKRLIQSVKKGDVRQLVLSLTRFENQWLT